MKPFLKFLFLFIIGFSIACTKSTNTDKSGNKGDVSLIGKWILIEQLTDPGDGSGTWHQDNSDAYIVFKSDSSFEYNKGNLNFNNVPFESVKYSLPNDSAITFIDSNELSYLRYYKINVDTLTIMGGCYEACGSKYIKQE